MKRLILLLMIYINTLVAYNYDELLLEAQAKIYPKIILLDKNLDKKIKNNTIIFTIVHHNSDYHKANVLKEKIYKKYHNKLGKYKLSVQTKSFDKIDSYDNSTAYYALNAPSNLIESLSKIAQKKHIILFSYDVNHFKNGSLVSLKIESEPKIYLNPKLHKLYNLKFMDIFYQIARFRDD